MDGAGWQQRVQALIDQHPTWKDGRIAEAACVPVGWVSELRKEAEWKLAIEAFYARKRAERLAAEEPEPKQQAEVPRVRIEVHRRNYRITPG